MTVKATPKRRGRPPAPVDSDTPGGRLRVLREARELTQDDLAAVLHVSRPQVTKYEEGKHAMSAAVLRKAAARFDVTPSFILFGEEVVFARRTAGLVGVVGAGAKVEDLELSNPELIEVPTEFEEAEAYRVSGDSCWPVFEDGDIVVVRQRQYEPTEMVGRFCVVQASDGNGYLKQLIKGPFIPGQGQQFVLKSPNYGDIGPLFISNARPVELRILTSRR